MSNDKKLKQKEKIKKIRYNKKKLISNSQKKTDVTQKISEKYLQEDIQVEKSLKLRNENKIHDDDYETQLQQEFDFFCDPFSSVQHIVSNFASNNQRDDEEIGDQDDEVISEKSEAPSNESPNTHLASTYLGHDFDPIIEKFELQRISYDEYELLFHPNSNIVDPMPLDEENVISYQKTEGFYVPGPPKIEKTSNKLLLLDRLQESASTELIDGSGDLKNFQKLFDDDIYRLVSDKQFTPIFVPPKPMNFDSFDNIIDEKRFLKIFISHLTFDQHNLFSSEHHVAKIVEKLFIEYDRRKKLDIVGSLRNKLNNLREEKSQNYANVDSEVKSNKSIKSEEISLNHQIKSVRQKLHVEEKYDHLVVKSLLEHWKKLKNIRTQQSSSFTSITLKIQKTEVDEVARKAKWQECYDTELKEIVAEEFDAYRMMKQKYKELVRNESELINEVGEPFKKPKKPDVDKIVARLNETYADIPFNEPEITIIMSNIFDNSREKSSKPKQKVKKISKYAYRIELEIDGETVGSTKHCKLDEDFSIIIQSAFIVKLTKQLPQKIKLLIMESKSTNRKLSEILLPLPDDDENFNDNENVDYDFSSRRLERRNSKSKFSSFRKNGSKRMINISGRISIKMGWTNGENGEERGDAKVLRKSIGRNENLVSQDVIKKWFDSNLIDPLDPDAENLVKFVQNESHEDLKLARKSSEGNDEKMFRLNEDQLAFCTEEEFNSIERFHLLRARHDNDLSYKDKKFIPQSDRELELERDKDRNIIDDSSIADPIDLQRYRGRKYLKKVYDTISNHCEILNRDKMNKNLLIHDESPSFGEILSSMLEFFGPKRPLKPTRRSTSSRASVKITDLAGFSIVVMVVRATNIPVRSEELTQTSSRKSSTATAPASKFMPFKSMSSHPHVFVTISLKDHHLSSRTSSAEGTNPMWNEQLKLPFNLKSDATKRVLSIDLYDEVVEDLVDNVTEVYQRISSKWLGSLKIPLAHIFTNQRIEGMFEMTIPTVLLGYTKPTFAATDQGYQTNNSEGLPHMSKKTHINLFISLEPNAEIPRMMSNGLECIEIELVERQIKMWFEQLKLEFPSRVTKWSPLITLLTGKRACITRLLHPLKFPFDKNDEMTEFKIRRFVSLIPLQNDASPSNSCCSGLNGVWLSNTQILGLMTSSNKDLGVLLTCYYLELGYPSWLILGSSNTCGECCYVLMRKSSEFFIIDPASGKKYSSKDVYCPLTSCFCLVNQYNVWANIQREQRIFMMQFDVNRSFDWRPMFQKVVDIPKETIHDVTFRYERSFHVKDLQQTIQAKIVKKINSWRSHKKTIWNRYVCENLKQILEKLEDDVCFENDFDDHAEMLKALYVNYKITGYTINNKYTNLSSIVNDIKNTGIHLNLDSKVEFASSVYIKEYANNVLSIWIFLMSLTPKM